MIPGLPKPRLRNLPLASVDILVVCTPIPGPYHGRDSQQNAWLERFGDQTRAAIDAVLTSFCEAFSCNPDARYVFGPDDQVMEVYRACYPRWKLWLAADSMKIETRMMDLKKEFGIQSEAWRPDISLGELVELAGRLNYPAE